MSILIKIIRIFVWAAFIGLFLFLLHKNFYPYEQVQVSCSVDKCSRLVKNFSNLKDQEIITEDLKVKQSSLLFNIDSLRIYDQADLSITYSKPTTDLIIQMPKADGNTLSKALYSSKIEELLADADWESTQKDNLLLLQRKQAPKRYTSVDNFLKEPPGLKEISQYNFSLAGWSRLENYKPANKDTVIDQPIKNGYVFYTYIEDESLNFKFNFSYSKLSEDYKLTVKHYPNNIVWQQEINDKEIEFNLSDISDGLYVIELQADEKLITEKIETSQKLIAFQAGLSLADSEQGYNLYTNANKIDFSTKNLFGFQDINVGEKNININQLYSAYQEDNVFTGKLTEIKTEKGSLDIRSDRLLTFSKEQFFWAQDLMWDVANLGTLEDFENINYIIADYTPLADNQKGQQVLTQVVSFDNLGYGEKGSKIDLTMISGIPKDPIRYLRLEDLNIMFHN